MSIPPSRRDRLREETVAHIQEVARRQLVEHGSAGISLRAIARELGMTAPGLYRYYPSLDELVTALIVDCYAEVTAQMERERDALPPEDLPSRLLAVSRAFRHWSVEHPAEFGLIFGAPVPGFARPPEGPVEEAGARFGQVFRDVFVQLWLHRPFTAPHPDELDPRLPAELLRIPGGSLGPGELYVFVACWVRLYGAVAMEVFGQLKWAVEEGEALFETELRQLSRMLAMADEYRPPR
ncbi:MAG: TetR/AcrR family transcriptional regulator [Actinomycetota bacterium]|nr:TetR/AcrR family transcriptional regulator [Nocardioidaceae bacterium]MDQ3480380.1 TetR/AcrR family transcriptional regulator [Actinomycetota bacterium]